MIRYIRVIALLLFLVPTIIYSGSPKEDFNDDVLLTKAILDIQKMPLEELNTFISYLASCGSYKGGQLQEFFCEKDRATYLIKYEKRRSLDYMISLLKIIWMWIESADNRAKPPSKEYEEIVKVTNRYADVILKIQDEANRRFQQLSTK
jgi:hypothetical protein